MSVRIPVTVDEEGRLVPRNSEATRRHRGRELYVSLHNKQLFQRSNPANRLMWAIYGRIADETGNDPDTIHQALKREAVRIGILDPQFILAGGQLLETEPTTVVDQEAHSRYISWLKQGCMHGDLVGMVIDVSDLGES